MNIEYFLICLAASSLWSRCGGGYEWKLWNSYPQFLSRHASLCSFSLSLFHEAFHLADSSNMEREVQCSFHFTPLQVVIPCLSRTSNLSLWLLATGMHIGTVKEDLTKISICYQLVNSSYLITVIIILYYYLLLYTVIILHSIIILVLDKYYAG